jgi:hypothetical protein
MKILKQASFVSASFILLVAASTASAQTTWLASPGTNDVNTSTNWSAGLPSATVDAHFATSTTTNPSQSAAITIRDMLFESGASAFTYGIASGQLSLINAGLNIVENNSTTTQVIGNTTGAGGTIGVSGLINAAAGDLVVNGATNVGNSSTSGTNFLALTGSHNIYFNVDPSINALGNLTGGAWTSSSTTNMHSNARGRFFLSPTFSGRVYFGDIGTAYDGAINVETQANGALRLTTNNSLGASGPVSHHPKLQISGGATGNGTLELAPATGTGISVARDVFFFDGRSGAVADDPHLLNVSGDNTLTCLTDWNTGIRTVYGTTSTGTIANPGNWNIQSDAGTLTLAGGTMYNTQSGPLTLQLMGAGNGVISTAINKFSTSPTLTILKKGTGTWTLTNPNTAVGGTIFDGNVTVQQGTLALTGSGSLANAPAIDVRSGSFLDLSLVDGGVYNLNTFNLKTTGAGTITGSLSAGTNNTISPGNAVTSGPSIGTLSISNALTLNGDSTLALELSNTPGNNDKISVGGDLTLNGTTNVPLSFVNGNLGNGTYTLLSYGGTLAGGLGNLNITGLPVSPRQTFTPTSNTLAKQITLVVTGNAANLIWVGGVNGNIWADGQAVANSINWTGHPTDNHFFDGDNVTFNSSGTTFTPNVSGTVNPGSVTFANGVGANYTVSGGTVNSAGPLTFSGAGDVALSNTSTTASSLSHTGSGKVDVTSGSFTVTGTFTKSGTGAFTFSNVGGAISLGSSVAINAGTITIDRTDDLAGASAITSNLSGAGTFRKQNTNTIELSGNNSGLTGTMVIAGGTMATRSTTALANTTVQSGATLDLGSTTSGPAAPGGGTAAINIIGSGVGGLGALAVTTPGPNTNGNNAHIGALTLAGDATIRVKAPAATSDLTNRAILWGDGPVVGNGNALTAIVDTSLGTATEVDFVNNGPMNLGNLNLSGGGVFYVGGSSDLGASGTITLGDAITNGDPTDNTAGRLGIYGNTQPAGSPVTVSKPISVSSAGGGIELYRHVGSYTLASSIALGGDLDIDLYNSSNSTTNTLSISGPITGTGNLVAHTFSSAASRVGVLELTSNNTYSGTTTVGGGGGFSGVIATSDRITLNVNGSHIGGGAYTVNTSGKLGGTGTISAGVTVNAGGTLSPGGGVGTLTVGSALFNTDGITNGKLLIEFNGDTDTIDKLVVTGTLDITNATTLDFDNLGAGVLNGSPKIFASYSVLTGTEFTNVVDLPDGYTIDYNYLGSKQIALVGGPSGPIGDYNNNGVVDAADYVLWRKNPVAHGGDPDGYNTWRQNFGMSLGSGSGLARAAVPEPGTFVLAIVAIFALAFSTRNRCNLGRRSI